VRVPQYNRLVQRDTITRRSFLSASLAAPAVLPAAAREREVVISDITFAYEDYLYRTPLKFGGTVVDRVTLLNVDCVINTRSGKTAKGFGSMPLGNVWSFPSKTMPYERTLSAMKELSARIAAITRSCSEYGHPIDLNTLLEPAYLEAAAGISKQQQLDEPIPKLCTLVTASPFDAAIHDAFGKLNGRNCYQTYGPDLMTNDLAHYVGPEFKGESLDRYIDQKPKATMPLYHLVGAVDPVVASDIRQRINDGLPETLPEWIKYNGLTNIKIKLNGDDLNWDVDRVLHVDKAASEAQAKRGVTRWVYSLDFNEKAQNVDYVLAFIGHVKEKGPTAFARIQYIEQPTKRDLKADRANVMSRVSAIVPVVIDESLTDQEMLMLSREMGYTGVALKACKGQSQAVLMAAVAQKYKMFLCVQDLTCPGASLIQSAGLAAHVPGVAAIEANARQYVPAANKPWIAKFPGIFVTTDGRMKTGVLDRPGLSAVA
jgi:L-alanine-DL-glutamate epimerase-like enolase superfamily enzyme